MIALAVTRDWQVHIRKGHTDELDYIDYTKVVLCPGPCGQLFATLPDS